MAATPRTCPRCGGVISGSRPEALCPVCLLESALGDALPEEPLKSGSRTTEWNGQRLPEPPAQLRYFGDYELVGELARGGMGIVYLARQTSLDRLVAVKLLLYGEFSSPAFVERFRTEAAAAARLQHPGIVGIFEIGEHEGHHFFSMEYVAGENLAQRVNRQPPPPREAAAWLSEVAEAVHFAHTHGILHRDLKPANVLVDRTGRARVTDFGLAKRLDRKSEITSTGEVLGSPCFMAPEQVLGDTDRVGVPADVYGLGAILYHALTGRPPLQASTVPATLNLVLRQEPLSPRILNPSVPRDLETICLKCLAKAPGQRYPDAAALQEDLQRFLRDEPIHARPAGLPERAWRWARRRPAAAGLVAAAALLMATLIGAGFLYGRQKEQARVKENRLRAESERQRYAMSINLAERARTEGDFAQADRLLAGVVPRPGDADLRGWEWYHLQHELRGQEERIVWSSTNAIQALAASASGDRLAVLLPQELRVIAVSNGVTLKVWPVANEGTGSRMLAFSPDGSGIVLGTLSGAVLYQGQQPPRSLLTEPANILAFSPDGTRLAFSSVNMEADMEAPVGVGVLDLTTERVLFRLATNGGPGLRWARTPSGSLALIWILGSRGQLTKWIPGQAPTHVWGNKHFADFAAFSPDCRRLWFDDVRGFYDDYNLATYNANDPNHSSPDHRLAWSVTRPALAFSADEVMVAVKNGADRRVAIIDVQTGNIINRYPGHRGELTGLTFIGNTHLLASSSMDGTVRLWDVNKSPENIRITNDLSSFGLPRPVFSDDSRLVAVVKFGALPQVRSLIYNIEDKLIVSEITGYVIKFSPDIKELIYWNSDNMFRRAYVSNVSIARKLTFSQSAAVGRSALTEDGSLLLFRNKFGALYAFEINSGRDPLLVSSNASPAVVSETGSRFVAATAMGVSIWDRNVRKLKPVLDKDALAFRFSPDDRLLAVGDIDGIVTIVESDTGRIVATLEGHGGEVNCVAFSPDGKTLVTGAEDRAIRFWRLPEGTLLFAKKLPENAHWLEFSKNGRWLAVGWNGAYEFLSAPLADFNLHSKPDGKLWNNVTR